MVSLNPLSRMKEKEAVVEVVVLFGKNEGFRELYVAVPRGDEGKNCGQCIGCTEGCRKTDDRSTCSAFIHPFIHSAMRKTKHR